VVNCFYHRGKRQARLAVFYPLSGSEHFCHRIHVLGLYFPGGNAPVRQVLKLQQQIHQCHRVNQSRGHQSCVFVNAQSRFADELHNMLDHRLYEWIYASMILCGTLW
jgi:hypothetical protein